MSAATVTCPFTGKKLAAVSAIRPDVAVIHAQQADRQGNVQMWGITGEQKEAVLAAQRSLVTVEEVVDSLELRPGGVVLPSWVVDPGGRRPRWGAPLLCLGTLPPRQRLLRAMGRHQPGPVHAKDATVTQSTNGSAR